VAHAARILAGRSRDPIRYAPLCVNSILRHNGRNHDQEGFDPWNGNGAKAFAIMKGADSGRRLKG
jgi:hypothetical protein